MKRSVLIPIALALMLIIALAPVTMAGPLDDTIIEANETVNNDVIVLDGDLTIHQGAVVNGDVTVFNGDATVNGRVSGSVTLFNGDLIAGDEHRQHLAVARPADADRRVDARRPVGARDRTIVPASSGDHERQQQRTAGVRARTAARVRCPAGFVRDPDKSGHSGQRAT